MFKKNAVKVFTIFQILLLVVLMIAFAGGFMTTPARAAATRIMPLGDSITGSPGCWRALLWNRLQTSGFTNIDFVGTLPPQGCGVTYDGDNEGHGGFLATNIANQNQLPAWLSATHPDIVIMHLGTNDVWNNIAPATILAAFSTLVDQMRASNPNIKIIVAQILPMNPSGCSTCAQGAINFNAAIPAWVNSKTTAQSPITIVDQWTGFNDATDTADGVHPNDLGIQKMSDKWYPAVVAALSGTVSPTLTPTRTNTIGINTITPTRTSTPTIGPSLTPTRTSTITPVPEGTPTAGPTATRTSTPTTGPVLTSTPTTGSGSTCSPVTSAITIPFTFDGAGTFCWQASSLGSFINSWNTISVTVNGVNETNIWVAVGSYPAKVNGFYYVGYNSNVAWGHFEAKP